MTKGESKDASPIPNIKEDEKGDVNEFEGIDPITELIASYRDDEVVLRNKLAAAKLKLPLPEFPEDTRESFGNTKSRGYTF